MNELLPVADRPTTARLAVSLLRRRPGALTLTALSFVVLGLAGIVPPWVIGVVVDAVDDGATTRRVLALTAVIAVAGVVAGLASWASASTLARLLAPTVAELREDLLDTALHLDQDRVERAGIGDIVARVSDDVRALTTSVEQALPMLLSSLVAVVFTVGGLVALDWRLGLAGLCTAPFYIGALRWYLPRSAPYYRRERTAEGERADALVNGVGQAATLRAFGAQGQARERIRSTSRTAREIAVDVFILFTRYGFRMNCSELLGLVFVLTTGFLLVDAGAVTVGAATAAALYFHRLFNPIGALLFVFDDVQASGAALARLAGVAALRDPERASLALDASEESVLSVEAVAHAYEPGHEVLHETSFAVRPGEKVAVVGATGAGKSTLGGIIAGAVTPTQGRVRVGATDLAALSPSRLRDTVCLVSQEIHVFTATVRENLALADGTADDERLWAVLRHVHADAWVRALADGLDTVIGTMGHAITPAQAQQLALARVVLRNPRLVVLDEATAEAGSTGARDLERSARAAVEGRAAIVIAHRLTQARTADRVIVMHEGRIVEEGTHDALVAADGRYGELWRAWSAGA